MERKVREDDDDDREEEGGRKVYHIFIAVPLPHCHLSRMEPSYFSVNVLGNTRANILNCMLDNMAKVQFISS